MSAAPIQAQQRSSWGCWQRLRQRALPFAVHFSKGCIGRHAQLAAAAVQGQSQLALRQAQVSRSRR
jgi:hypothetical protein